MVGMVVTISLFETAIGRAGVDREEDERSVCVSVFAHEEKKVTSATALKSSVTPQSPSSATAEGEEEEERTRDETRAEWSAATAASGSLAASDVETMANGVVVVAGGAAAAAEASITAGSSRLSCWEMAAILFFSTELLSVLEGSSARR